MNNANATCCFSLFVRIPYLPNVRRIPVFVIQVNIASYHIIDSPMWPAQ